MKYLRSGTAVILLAMSVAVAFLPAIAKRKHQDADSASASTATKAPKDAASLDELLSTPVKALPTDPFPNVSAPQPKPKEHLKGAVETSEAQLEGQAQSAGGVGGTSLQPKADPREPLKGNATENSPTILKGNAVMSGGKLGAQQDPDLEDRELMVEWDRWRNKFLRAAQLQVQAGINNADGWDEETPRANIVYDPTTGTAVVQPRFPMGTEAWFSCEITVDRQIKNLKITRTSGFPAYDKAVIEGVRALEGTSLLNYPAGSHRTFVNQSAGIRTASSSDYQYHQFGDVERVRPH